MRGQGLFGSPDGGNADAVPVGTPAAVIPSGGAKEEAVSTQKQDAVKMTAAMYQIGAWHKMVFFVVILGVVGVFLKMRTGHAKKPGRFPV